MFAITPLPAGRLSGYLLWQVEILPHMGRYIRGQTCNLDSAAKVLLEPFTEKSVIDYKGLLRLLTF